MLENIFDFVDIALEAWKKYVDFSDDETSINRMRKHTLAGRPFGGSDFVKELEQQYGRKLAALPRGRLKYRENAL